MVTKETGWPDSPGGGEAAPEGRGQELHWVPVESRASGSPGSHSWPRFPHLWEPSCLRLLQPRDWAFLIAYHCGKSSHFQVLLQSSSGNPQGILARFPSPWWGLCHHLALVDGCSWALPLPGAILQASNFLLKPLPSSPGLGPNSLNSQHLA